MYRGGLWWFLFQWSPEYLSFVQSGRRVLTVGSLFSLCRISLPPLVRHLMRFLNVIRTVTATGRSMLILNAKMGTRTKQKRWEISLGTRVKFFCLSWLAVKNLASVRCILGHFWVDVSVCLIWKIGILQVLLFVLSTPLKVSGILLLSGTFFSFFLFRCSREVWQLSHLAWICGYIIWILLLKLPRVNLMALKWCAGKFGVGVSY